MRTSSASLLSPRKNAIEVGKKMKVFIIILLFILFCYLL
tara:strand:- start:3190 stop:3306 length:117 start_codon:yes stop_codon:yes gene_type:complete